MYTVTQRAKGVHQPRGGYLKPSMFSVTHRDDGETLSTDENIHASVVGMAVDYLTRLGLGENAYDSFWVALRGFYAKLHYLTERELEDECDEIWSVFKIAWFDLLRSDFLSDKCIVATCKLVCFDAYYRSCTAIAFPYKGACPDEQTIQNIRIMVKRSLSFFHDYGPVAANGFSLDGGYTDIVSVGDGDFLTESTVWDFKVSKSKITSKHTLQILMYYLMGKRSGQSVFKSIHQLGFFNPRLNDVYLLDVSLIDADVLAEVERNVIGYTD